MPESFTPVDTFNVEYLCDQCGTPMTFDKALFLQRSTLLVMRFGDNRYPHECRRCGCKNDLPHAYPYVTTKEKAGGDVGPRMKALLAHLSRHREANLRVGLNDEVIRVPPGMVDAALEEVKDI